MSRQVWPEWAYDEPANGIEALRQGGLYITSPADAAPGEEVAAATLVQPDGDVITWYNSDLPEWWIDLHSEAVQAAVRDVMPFRRSWDWLGRAVWLGPAIEAALIGWDLGTNGWQPGKVAELVWQSGWLGGSLAISGLAQLGRWLLKRRLQTLLTE